MPVKTQPTPETLDPQEVAVERRRAERFLCQRECVVRPEDATGIGAWSGIVYNVSETGLGLVLPYVVPVGKILIVEPWGRGKAHAVRARVVRSVARSFVFFHGCELLLPLTQAELRSWLN